MAVFQGIRARMRLAVSLGIMGHALELIFTAPFALGDYAAEVRLAGGGTTRVVLRGGRFSGEVPEKAVRVRLLLDDFRADDAPLALDDPGRATVPEGTAVGVGTAFDQGVDVPENGILAAQLVWGMPCHEGAIPEQTTDGTRFGAWEHILCADYVGLDIHEQPLVINGVAAALTKDTKLDVGGKSHTFGQIIALAGDYYAFFDEVAKADKALSDFWPNIPGLIGDLAGDYRSPTLWDAPPEDAKAILDVVFRDRDKKASTMEEILAGLGDALFHGYPGKRYAALASQNYCHFGHQPWDGTQDDLKNEALRNYRLYHARAVAHAAARKPLAHAFAIEAFACHFLTDLFAAGHIRIPRRALTEKLGTVGGGKAAGDAHNEDNAGLWVRMRKSHAGARVVWRAYGDNFLREAPSKQHLEMVRDAVRRSVEEVLRAFAGAPQPRVLAEHLLPVPLAPGDLVQATDLQPDAALLGPKHAAIGARPASGLKMENGFPLYTMSPQGALGQRVGKGPTYKVVRGDGQFTLGGAT